MSMCSPSKKTDALGLEARALAQGGYFDRGVALAIVTTKVEILGRSVPRPYPILGCHGTLQDPPICAHDEEACEETIKYDQLSQTSDGGAGLPGLDKKATFERRAESCGGCISHALALLSAL